VQATMSLAGASPDAPLTLRISMISYRRVLVLGGARSGKSRMAQELIEVTSQERIYIATAEAHDSEMRDRIARHQVERDSLWQTYEAPLDLVEAIRIQTAPGKAVLVDCLTLWLSNILLAEWDLNHECERLVQVIGDAAGPLILVSNEVGHGIVPATSMGRTFRDAQGQLNQSVARACDAVVFVAAGCPILLKPAPSLQLTLG
jgi:adenosylcobinamide kinase / adenosylcobinamide-phosphate guanylyltransferase